jgi:uncharacterized protein (TIGR03790 family)
LIRKSCATIGVIAAILITCGSFASPALALDADELAVVINTDDPASEQIGVYYAAARAIPSAQVLRVRLGIPRETISPETFAQVRSQLREQTPKTVQAYALAWTLPYRVGCMSITTAVALGYGTRFCADGCKPTAPNPYFDSPSRQPYRDHFMRPAMLLAAETVANAKQLIDRGVRSDGLHPRGRGYLVVTDDVARGTRAPLFPGVKMALADRIPIEILRRDGVRDAFDVMFYFTGAVKVPYLSTLGFLPGAIADHLTSAGGVLKGTGQMSALRWLEAGATGSYGAVVEPCNFPQKFPHPGLVMKYYLDGETLIEAYWKSVVWPGQGVFIGEPLAHPFAAKPAS